jgi:hypothetical protein
LDKVKKIFQAISKRISNVLIGAVLFGRTLLGIKKTEDGYQTRGIEATGWTILFGIPFVLLFFPNFFIPYWVLFVITFLVLLNLDEGLILLNLMKKHGAKTIYNIKNYDRWKQGLYNN